MKAFCPAIVAILLMNTLSAQDFQTRDKVSLNVGFDLARSNQIYNYSYSVSNGIAAQESVYVFDIRLPNNVPITSQSTSSSWKKVFFSAAPEIVRWHATVDRKSHHFKDLIGPGTSRSGFSFGSNLLPGIVIYYSEGWAPAPVFEEGEATDSIPGYSDLTAYGPGVVGKTVGPTQLPNPFNSLVFLDTLLSYIDQSHSLGWINNTRDDDAEQDENAEDGIVKNLDKRLTQTRDLIDKGKTDAARNRLEKFLDKVEKLWARQQKEEAKNRKNPKIIFTSEAYALLKYNGEYLLDHLTEPKVNKEDKKGKEK